jgi:glycosyltransferase involved in cell wall biosynthesis
VSESAPFFTVAVPVFNGRAYIRKAIDSVLAQTFDDWELIVIDNQSTDGTWELLQDVYGTQAGIKLLRNESNLGMNRNLARCVREARGEWVAILAADDSYVTHALETAHREMGRRENLVLWVHSELVFGATFVGIRVIHADAVTLNAKETAATLYKRETSLDRSATLSSSARARFPMTSISPTAPSRLIPVSGFDC